MSGEEFIVLSKCANPMCTARMKYLHQGRIFIVESPSATQYWRRDAGSFSAPPGNQIEYFWLCARCSRQMKVTPAGCLEYLSETLSEGCKELPFELGAWELEASDRAELAPMG